MRLSPPITILAILFAAITALATTGQRTLGYARSCAVLADFNGIARYNPKPDLFSGPPLASSMTATHAKELVERFPDTAEARIARTLVLRSTAEKPIDPVKVCPEHAKRLRASNIDFDRSAVAAALDFKQAKLQSPDRPIYVLAMRLPLVSPDGKYALVEMTYSSAVYQSGDMFLLRKGSDGKWVEAAMLQSWMT